MLPSHNLAAPFHYFLVRFSPLMKVLPRKQIKSFTSISNKRRSGPTGLVSMGMGQFPGAVHMHGLFVYVHTHLSRAYIPLSSSNPVYWQMQMWGTCSSLRNTFSTFSPFSSARWEWGVLEGGVAALCTFDRQRLIGKAFHSEK